MLIAPLVLAIFIALAVGIFLSFVAVVDPMRKIVILITVLICFALAFFAFSPMFSGMSGARIVR